MDIRYCYSSASMVGYKEMKNKSRNALFKDLGADRLFVAADNIITLQLPYKGIGAVIVPSVQILKAPNISIESCGIKTAGELSILTTLINAAIAGKAVKK